MPDYNKDLANRIDEYLKSQNWRFKFDEDDGVFRFGMNLDNKMRTCNMVIQVGENHFTSYGCSPVGADADTMAAVNGFITRANYGLRHGNFELDLRDGELRYKNSLFCGNNIPAIEVVEQAVDISFLMWKRYGNGLLNVIFAAADPAQEIAKIED